MSVPLSSVKTQITLLRRRATGTEANKMQLKSVISDSRPWMVCVAAFIVQFLMGGLVNCSGVMYAHMLEEFESGRGATAWVGSLPAAVLYFTAPVSTSLSQRYGCRASTIVGALTCILAMVLSSFYTSLYYLYLTHGVIWGLGLSLCYFPTFIVISQHFKTRLSLATGIITCGGSVGTLVLSPGTQWLFNKFGLSSSLRILGAVHVVLFACGATFGPLKGADVPSPGTKKRIKYFDWTICKNRAFLVYMIALVFVMLGYLVPYVHLVRLAQDTGAKPTEAALLISYLAIGSGMGRLIFGRIADCKQCNRFYVWQTGLLGISVSSTLVTMVTSYKWLVVYAIVFGLFEGCYVALNPVLIRDIVGEDKFAHGLGMSFFVMSFTRSAGPPIVGWIYDSFQSYYVAFLYTGLVFQLGNCVAFVAQLLLKKSHRTEQGEGTRTRSHLIVHRETDV